MSKTSSRHRKKLNHLGSSKGLIFRGNSNPHRHLLKTTRILGSALFFLLFSVIAVNLFFAKSASAADAETAQITVYDNSVSTKKYWTVPSNYDCAKADKVSETQYKAKDGGKTASTRDNPQGVQIWEKGDKISGELCKVKPTMKKVSGAINSQALCEAKLIQDGSIEKDWETTHASQPTASYKRPVYSDGTIKTPGITNGAFRNLKTPGCYLVSYSGVGGTSSSAQLLSDELMYKPNGDAANKAEKDAAKENNTTWFKHEW